MLLLSKQAHIDVMSRIFEPSISLKIVTPHISKQIRANIQGAHKNNTGEYFQRTTYQNWYSSVFAPNQNICGETISNFSAFRSLSIKLTIWQPWCGWK